MVLLIDQQLRTRRENNGVRVIISSIVCLLVVGVTLWHYQTSVTNKIRSRPEEEQEDNPNNMSSDEQKAAEIDDSTTAREEWEKHRDELYDCLMHPTAASSSSSSQSSHGVPTLLKTLDAAVRILKLARMIDSRLQNNTKIDVFYQQLETIERDCNRYFNQSLLFHPYSNTFTQSSAHVLILSDASVMHVKDMVKMSRYWSSKG